MRRVTARDFAYLSSSCDCLYLIFSRMANFTSNYFLPDDDLDRTIASVNNTNDSAKSSKIICSECNISFSAKKNLYRHQRNVHSRKEIPIPANKVCPICDSKLRTITDLHVHITDIHEDINLKFEKKTFHTDNDFQEWKSAVEKEDTSYFTIKGKWEHGEKIVTEYYECNRSGAPNLKESTKRKRHSKVDGSIKIGKTCPAIMKVSKQTLHEATEIVVEYQMTHVGHEQEPGKLRLTHKERMELAGMLHCGIPTNVILDKVVLEQYSPSPTKRLQLVRRKDIHNIRRDFRIDKSAIEHGKVTHRVRLIRQKHLMSEKLDENFYSVSETGDDDKWVVCKQKESLIFTYDIKIGDKNCQCQIMCVDCGICLHTLTCSCIQYRTGRIICKHIHFFCRKFKFSRNECLNENGSGGELVVDVNEYKEQQALEMLAIVSQIKKKTKIDISVEKSSLAYRLQCITNQIQTLETPEDLNGAAEHIKTLELYLESISSKPCLPNVAHEVKNAPVNKTIDPQRKFK